MKKNIPFNHSTLHAKRFKKDILKSIGHVIDSGSFLGGSVSQALEEKLSEMLNVPCLTTASGHDSLYLAIIALQLVPSDEILFPVNAYPTAFPLFMAHSNVIPVDCDVNGQMDIKDLKKKITSHTKVIVLVHMYGQTTDIERIMSLAKRKKITVIEDCAQSFGSTFNGQLTGTIGDIGCFSFYPTKNVGTLGDGGAICCKNPQIYSFIKKAKSYGEECKYHSTYISGHSRLPEIQAAILHIYLDSFSQSLQQKKKLYSLYKEAFKKADLLDNVSLLHSHPDSDPLIHLFVIKAKKRDELHKYLKQHGIDTLIHYPVPIHKVEAFSKYIKPDMLYKQAESLASEILSLPFHEYMTQHDIDYIVSSISRFYSR